MIVCEHASNTLPKHFGDLGISAAVQASHVAYDPGAAGVATRLAERLGAPLVTGGVSRLVYDCNRPPDAPDAIAAVSEIHRIPGNADLAPAARARRIAEIYEPFAAALEALLAARTEPQALVSIHTFTPVYLGAARKVAIGVVHDADARLADALIAAAPEHLPWPVVRNEPYGPDDRVTTTLRRHALPAGRLNAMIEIRNDLVATPDDETRMADAFAGWMNAALGHLRVRHAEGATCPK